MIQELSPLQAVLFPVLLQGPRLAASHSPSWTIQLILLLRKPGDEKEEFTTSLQLLCPADSTDSDCTRFHNLQHNQRSPLLQQNTFSRHTYYTFHVAKTAVSSISSLISYCFTKQWCKATEGLLGFGLPLQRPCSFLWLHGWVDTSAVT